MITRGVTSWARRTIVAAIGILTLADAGALVPDAGGHARVRELSFTGHTSQRPRRYGPQRLSDNRVSFTVSGDRVRDFTISWLAPCSDGYGPTAPLIDRSAFDPLVLRHLRFSIHDGGYQSSPGRAQRANVTLRLDGTIRGRWASGTLSVSAVIIVDNSYGADSCETAEPIRWRARITP